MPLNVLSKRYLQKLHEQQIAIALAKCDGNRQKAAMLLGIHERTLNRDIERRTKKENF